MNIEKPPTIPREDKPRGPARPQVMRVLTPCGGRTTVWKHTRRYIRRDVTLIRSPRPRCAAYGRWFP